MRNIRVKSARLIALHIQRGGNSTAAVAIFPLPTIRLPHKEFDVSPQVARPKTFRRVRFHGPKPRLALPYLPFPNNSASSLQQKSVR
ncbi:hypothetical protein Trydic_g23914 [Trypoxylus dichotomus]